MDASKVLVLALVAGLYGCASAEPAESPSESSDEVSVGNLLTWPLEGEAGADKTIAALRGVIQVREKANPGQFYGRGPAQLEDGHILTFASITPENRIASIGVASEPCFATEKAVVATQAVADAVTEDMHGVDVGRTYNVVRNGMRLTFKTTKKPYACLDGIYIARERPQ